MTVTLQANASDAEKPGWTDSDAYAWMASLSEIGWAWEFLRRNPRYKDDFQSNALDPAPQSWGLVRLEDPALDARQADIFWQSADCAQVLPLKAFVRPVESTARPLEPERLQCQVALLDNAGEARREIVFRQDARQLQISVTGDAPLENALLLTSVLPDAKAWDSRLLSVRRLTDLVRHGRLRPELYPGVRRAPRLMRVIQALDGWQTGAAYRDIAVALFGISRVNRDWSDPRNHLRDQVRRAVRVGRELMTNGYRRFLF